MAFPYLTDLISRFRRSFYPDQFLTGRIRHGQLYLSCTSPGRDADLWPEHHVILPPETKGMLPPPLPVSLEERKRLPFLLFWPYERTVTAQLRFPPSVTSDEKEAAIGALIELQLPWSIEETLLAWESDPSDPSSIHAWAINKSEMESWVVRLQEAGLFPRWVLPESLFILDRLLPRSTERSGRLLASPPLSGLIESDGSRTLCLLGRGTHVTGEGSFLNSHPQGASSEKKILDLLLSFLAEGHTLPPTFLLGPGIIPTPFLETISASSPEPPRAPSLAGWRRISSHSREEIKALSFLKGSLAWQGDRQERTAGFRVLFFLSLLLVATLILDASVHLSRINHRLDEARSALDLAASRALPGHRIVEPVGQLTQELSRLDQQKALLSQGPDIIRIMRDLTTSPPPGISYEMISLNVTRRFFTVSGKTDSFKSVDALKKAFASTGHMSDLVIQSAGLDIDRKTVTFRLRGRHD